MSFKNGKEAKVLHHNIKFILVPPLSAWDPCENPPGYDIACPKMWSTRCVISCVVKKRKGNSSLPPLKLSSMQILTTQSPESICAGS